MLKKFVEDHIPWEEPHAGTGEESEVEGVAEPICELTATPIYHPPASLAGRK